MEEGTIFNNQDDSPSVKNEQQNVPPLEPQPTPPPQAVPVSQEKPLHPQHTDNSGLIPPPPPQGPLPPLAAPPGIDHSDGFNFKKVLKIAGAIVAAVLVLILIVAVILPKFSSKPKDGNATLIYWGLWEDQNVMKGVISDFERENPKIKVEYKKEDPKQYRDRLNVRIQNGTGPDIFRFHNSWYPMLSTLLLPLPSETIQKEEFRNNYYKVAQNDLIKNGAVYGIPLEVDTLALFVNQKLLSDQKISVPADWNEFIDVSSSLTTRNEQGKIDVAGASIGTYENIDHAPDIISLLFAQNGVDLNDITKSTPKVEDALRFYANFALVENNVWDNTLDDSFLAFSKGKSAMVFGYSWDYFTIKALSPDLNFKIYPVPQLAKGRPINMASYWAEGVSTKSKHQKEALLFMKFLAKKETQQKIYSEESKTRLFGEPYSNVSLAPSLKNTDSFVFVNQAKTAVSSPFVDSTNDSGLNFKLDNYLKDAINSILSVTSVESATTTLLDGYTQVMTSYGQ